MNRIANYGDFKTVLKNEFAERAGANPHYSLRAFARTLNLSPPRLSDILRGRYGLSKRAAIAIAKRLGYNKSEQTAFACLVESKHARSRIGRDRANAELQAFRKRGPVQDFQLEAFRVISDWYHFALLELTYVKDFQSNPAWIAKQLGISISLVKDAIGRLKKLDLLIETQGKLTAPDLTLDVPGGVPSSALKNFHRQILNKAIQAIDEQSVEERELSSVVIALRNDQLPEAKKMISDFRKNFLNALGSNVAVARDKNQVYFFSNQFFSLNPKKGTAI
jgi:uncharacterized protein (TIGR02147 family)